VHVFGISYCRTQQSGLSPFTGVDMVSHEIQIASLGRRPLADGSEPEAEPLVLHIVFELTMYTISDKCGLTLLIFLIPV